MEELSEAPDGLAQGRFERESVPMMMTGGLVIDHSESSEDDDRLQTLDA